MRRHKGYFSLLMRRCGFDSRLGRGGWSVALADLTPGAAAQLKTHLPVRQVIGTSRFDSP